MTSCCRPISCGQAPRRSFSSVQATLIGKLRQLAGVRDRDRSCSQVRAQLVLQRRRGEGALLAVSFRASVFRLRALQRSW